MNHKYSSKITSMEWTVILVILGLCLVLFVLSSCVHQDKTNWIGITNYVRQQNAK